MSARLTLFWHQFPIFTLSLQRKNEGYNFKRKDAYEH